MQFYKICYNQWNWFEFDQTKEKHCFTWNWKLISWFLLPSLPDTVIYQGSCSDRRLASKSRMGQGIPEEQGAKVICTMTSAHASVQWCKLSFHISEHVNLLTAGPRLWNPLSPYLLLQSFSLSPLQHVGHGQPAMELPAVNCMSYQSYTQAGMNRQRSSHTGAGFSWGWWN